MTKVTCPYCKNSIHLEFLSTKPIPIECPYCNLRYTVRATLDGCGCEVDK